MTSKLYIASKSAVVDALPHQHLYLVYDPDGDEDSGDEKIIRGGPTGGTTGLFGYITLEIDNNITASQDGGNINNLPDVQDRNFTLLASGTAADNAWAAMAAWANSIDVDNFETPFTYDLFNSNSNSVVTSALAAAGINVFNELPVLGGDLDGNGIQDGGSSTDRLSLSLVPAALNFLSGSESNTFAGGSENRGNIFYDTAGSDNESGNDIFYGGALNNKINDNPTDGRDTYIFIQSGAGSVEINYILDGSGTAIGKQAETPDGGVDELYSIERVFNHSFSATHSVNFLDLNAGISFQDLDQYAMLELNDEIGVPDVNPMSIDTASNVDLGFGIVDQYGNFGTFIGTDYADTFTLNQIIGRSFDGAGATNTWYGIGDSISYYNYGEDNGQGVAFDFRSGTVSAMVSPTISDTIAGFERYIGTDYTDNFTGIADIGTLAYSGGEGGDNYIIDLAEDEGDVYIDDQGTTGINNLIISSASDVVVSYAYYSGYSGYGSYNGRLDFKVGDDEFYSTHILGVSSVDNIVVDGSAIRVADFEYFRSNGLLPYYSMPLSDLVGLIYGPLSGYQGGVKPTIDSGDIVSIDISAAVSTGYYAAQYYTEENLHPLLITSLSSGGGTAEASMETFVKSIDFLGDVTASDIRLTASNDLNEASLTIYFGGQSFTIDDFENGRTINPVGLYDTAFHTQVEGATTAALTQTALGDFTGDYTYTGSFTYTASTTPVTYFLETLHFTTGSDIDLQASTLTFKGTTSADTLYGLNTRGDIIQGDAGNDTLYGYGGNDQLNGGEGADTLYGGLGDDTYSVDNAGDIVVESSGEGTDSVYATVSIAALADNVENLFFNVGGVGNLNGTGNALSNVIVGNDSDNILDGGAGNDYLSGYGGNDTFIVDSYSDVIYETTGTDTVHITIPSYSGYYTAPTNVENLTLASGILMNMYGNSLDNVIMGNETNNKMNGWDGADTLMGGAGNDTYYIYDVYDNVVEYAGEGTDSVYAKVSYTLDAYVENLVVHDSTNINGTGNSLNNTLTGGAGNNTLYGLDGNDTLNGADGTDILIGGAGDDLYIVDTTTDTITEASGEGTDTVQSSVTYTIASLANLENVTLTGSSNINATGNTADNILKGNSGNNTLSGGNGNDTVDYSVAGGAVTVSLTTGTATGHGSDTLSGIENIIGSAYADTLTGSTGANILNGGAGNDTMTGGAGDDTYYVDSYSDTITESAGQGADAIHLNISTYSGYYTIANNVENLTLASTILMNVYGNSLNNVITGNETNNKMNGWEGADTLVGGAGNDTYYIYDIYDSVIEYANEGTDAVYAKVSYTLDAYVENLVIHDDTNINGTGNSLNNVLTGGGGNNTLTGMDGDDTLNGKGGSDTLQGGNGSDTFVLEDSYISDVDTIVDFNLGQGDKLDLRDLLSAYDPLTDLLTDFVEITTSGSDSIVKVDMDGTGSTYSLLHVATIQGLTGLTDEAALVSSGNLLIS